MFSPRKIIIDTDLGFDDARALMLLLTAPKEQFDILAITCVFGNTNMPQCVGNVKRILRLCDREEIPIYAGAAGPFNRISNPADRAASNKQETSTDEQKVHLDISLCTECEIKPEWSDKSIWTTIWECHAKDGLGDQPQVWPESREEDKKSAVEGVLAYKHISALCAANPHEITLVTLGPLANIALALLNDEHLSDNLADVYMMGATVYGAGNTSPYAEANIYNDAVAAHVVFSTLKCPVVVAPWDLCTNDTPVQLDTSVDYSEHLNLSTRRSVFLRHVGRSMIKMFEDMGTQCVYIDEIATGCLIDPTVILDSKTFNKVTVQACECDNKRGAMTFENVSEGNGNFKFIVKYDARKLNNMMNNVVNVE